MVRRKETKEKVVQHEEEYEEIIELTDVVEEDSQTSYTHDKSSENPEMNQRDFLSDEESPEETYIHEIDSDEASRKSPPDTSQSQKMIGIDELDAKIIEEIIREVSQDVAEKIAPDLIRAIVKAMDEKMESIVHELFPKIAEKMITEEIRKLKEGED